jgi:hypothetical protein
VIPQKVGSNLDSTNVDEVGRVDPIINPYVNTQDLAVCEVEKEKGLSERVMYSNRHDSTE